MKLYWLNGALCAEPMNAVESDALIAIGEAIKKLDLTDLVDEVDRAPVDLDLTDDDSVVRV